MQGTLSGRVGEPIWAIWAYRGPYLGVQEALSGGPWASNVSLGALYWPLGALWDTFGRHLGGLGHHLGGLGRHVGSLGHPLGALGRHVGARVDPEGAKVAKVCNCRRI